MYIYIYVILPGNAILLLILPSLGNQLPIGHMFQVVAPLVGEKI